MNQVATMDVLDWDRFVADFWDRAPVLITELPAPPFQAGEVFRAAVGGTRRPAPRVMPPNVQVLIGRDQQVEPGEWLPEQSDRSLAGYQQRMAERLGGRRYALVVHYFHSFHAPQWRREVAFYAGLWQRVGLPLTGAITTAFHGSYQHSPVGVHLDRFATFMYALSGRKRMRFWPDRPWSEPVTSMLDYQRFLDSSVVVEVEPGQLLYWPASYYHVGESDLDDQPATSINVGVPRTEHRARYDIEDFLYDQTPGPFLSTDPGRWRPEPAGLLVPAAASPAAARPTPGPRAAVPPTPGPQSQARTELDGALPSVLARMVETVRAGGGADRIRDRVTALSLQRWTAGGFLPPPAPAPRRSLAGGDMVRATAPIRWAQSGPSRLVAANGHVEPTSLPVDQLTRLITRLAAGTPLPVAEVPDRGRELLAALEAFRALVRC